MKKLISKLTSKIDVKEIANIIRDDIEDRFEEGKNFDGKNMKPILKSTIDIKRQRGGINPSKPLVFKGGSKSGIRALTISKKEAVIIPIGTAKGYFGKSISSGTMLRFQREKGRDPFGVSKDARKAIVNYIKSLFSGR